MHALIIEDEPMIAMGIEDILRDCGFNSFDLASSPETAFDAVSRICPDLITSDVQLLPGSGIDTVMAICSRTPIPIIFITGNVSDVAKRMPETVALAKPFTEKNLRQAVVMAMSEPYAMAMLVLTDEAASTSLPVSPSCVMNARNARN